MSKLNTLVTPAAVSALNKLYASADGPAVCAAALRVINARTPKIGEDAAAVAASIFAAWPGMAPEDGPLSSRILSAQKAASLACKRANAAAVSDAVEERDTVSLDALSDAVGEPELPTGTYSRAADAGTRTGVRYAAGIAVSEARARGLSDGFMRAVAMPAGRKAGTDGAIVRALGLPTDGRNGAAARAAVRADLATLRECGAAALSALAMRAPKAALDAATRQACADAVVSVANGADAAAVRNVGMPVWDTGCQDGPRYSAQIRPAIGPETAPSQYVGDGPVCGRVAFLPEKASDDMSAAPTAPLAPLPGVRPGQRSGNTVAGEGKAFRVQASRKRKRDGAIGSPMI